MSSSGYFPYSVPAGYVHFTAPTYLKRDTLRGEMAEMETPLHRKFAIHDEQIMWARCRLRTAFHWPQTISEETRDV